MRATPARSTYGAIRSVPADPESPGAAPAAPPAVVTDATNDVGFLDTVGLDPATVEVAIDRAFRSLAAGAVLAVHGMPTAELDALCGRGRLELITTIRHSSGGTTYTVRERPTPADDDADADIDVDVDRTDRTDPG